MNIENIKIQNHGYVTCKSDYYTVEDILPEHRKFVFHQGINRMLGDIDSGIFAISYYISMFKKIDKKGLYLPHIAEVNNTIMQMYDLSQVACYMDLSNSLFSNKTVHQLIDIGLQKTEETLSCGEIREMFCLDNCRFERRVCQTGNERIRAMAAIGYAFGKEVFCYPWFSQMRYESLRVHLDFSYELLASLGKTVIVPLGKD